MTALVPVWTPDDYAETLAAARRESNVDLADAVYAMSALGLSLGEQIHRDMVLDRTLDDLEIPYERPSVVPPATRGWFYRGQHRPGGVRQSVAELEAEAERHPNGCDARLGPCADCRRVFGRPAR